MQQEFLWGKRYKDAKLRQECDTTTQTACSGKFSSFNIKMKEKPQPGFNYREIPVGAHTFS